MGHRAYIGTPRASNCNAPMRKQRFRLGCSKRLSSRKAFARVFAARCSAADHLLVVYALPNGLPYSRIGLSVGRRVGSAVQRNRAKRRLREAFRLEQHKLPAALDLVLVVRANACASLDDYRQALRNLVPRAAARALRTGDL